MMLGRRELAAIAGAVMVGGRPSWAQRPGAVRAPVPPSPGQAGDVVAVMLRGPAAAGSVMVFGQVFRRGDVPRDGALLARQAGGERALPVRLDVKTRHSDGSVRHAVVSLAVPALRVGEWTLVILARGNADPAPPISLAAALNGRSAVLEITPAGGGAQWRVDLIKLAQAQAASPGAGAMWQEGALASQIRVALPVPAEAVGGAATPRLVVDLALRSDATLWAAVWIRNDLAMQRSGGAVEYVLRLGLDAREALRTGPFRQAQYQGFGRTRAVGRGGIAAPVIGVHHDVAYLADAGAVPNFDIAAGVDERLLGRLAQGMSVPAWDTPLSPRGFTQYMGTTGGRGDIGTVRRGSARTVRQRRHIFTKSRINNWSFLASSISEWTDKQGAPHGWASGTSGAAGLIASWQQDYFAMMSATAAMRGNARAAAFLRWQSNFLIGRFVNEANGFRPTLGAGYQLAVSDSQSTLPLQGTVFRTWAEMDRRSEERRILPPKPWGSVGYNAGALAVLAELYNVLGDERASDLFVALSRQMQGTSLADYQQAPTFAFVPRGFSRAGRRTPSCARPSLR